MISSGPSGFYNAPVTKGIILLTTGVSLLSAMTSNRSGDARLMAYALTQRDLLSPSQIWRFVSGHLIFGSSGEIFYGLLLLYNFRLFERQMGSIKYGGFVFLIASISTLLQIAFLVLNSSSLKYINSGPYALIYACFVLFYKDIPSTFSFSVMGVRFSDKAFTYLFGVQLMMCNWPPSFAAALSGLLAGLIYRSDALRLRRFKLPNAINNFCRQVLLPFMGTSTPPNRGNPRQGGNQRARPRMQAQEGSQGYQDTLLGPDPGMGWGAGQADFRPHINPPQARAPPPVVQPPSEESISQLTDMGFSRQSVLAALARANNNVEIATNHLLDST
eukprot:GFYU01004430.1.p1 GENE.GFYU01004430.1~~GFYU01004430.1.p1  ORF type:complete len:331 (-),score=34.05 GFYU01004430.1:313-1305(-)